jgi:Domain of unknown function (DUF4249)
MSYVPQYKNKKRWQAIKENIAVNPATCLLFLILILAGSCVTEYMPVVNEQNQLLVVEGLITDQPGADTVRLSKSLPFGRKSEAKPYNGCTVMISDDLGSVFNLKETKPGTYITDSAAFNGKIGRTYTLHISPVNGGNYESIPMEMKPVPPVDSVYYEKTVIKKKEGFYHGIDGCQIYLDTHDPSNNCRFYRWDYSETWEFRLPYFVENRTCWRSETSDTINIKSTAAFDEARIVRQPVTFVTNVTDRLNRKYSILVNQYSLNEDEFIYWEKIQNLTNNTGGLYDIIPSSISGNMVSVENPSEKVLGYFSVSATTSKRIFIKDDFDGIIDHYNNCADGTIYSYPPEGLGESVWILEDHLDHPTPFWIITHNRGCVDCTTRGSNKKPAFWQDDN